MVSALFTFIQILLVNKLSNIDKSINRLTDKIDLINTTVSAHESRIAVIEKTCELCAE